MLWTLRALLGQVFTVEVDVQVFSIDDCDL